MKQPVDLIYRVLVHKRFRSGPLPSEKRSAAIREVITAQLVKEEPVRLFQFWGGCKNPNLTSHRADICEELTLLNLHKLYLEVRDVYEPGLAISIFPGDERISRVNGVNMEAAREYVKDLARLASGISDIFTVIPVSSLYAKYRETFFTALQDAEKKIGEEVFGQPQFEKLFVNAQKNIRREQVWTDGEFLARCKAAARSYIVYRVAEEMAGIYNEYSDHIRCSFIRFSPFYAFYNQYIDHIDSIRPSLGSVLHFYTGSKGNITQPWQALGCKEVDGGKRIVYISGERINHSIKPGSDVL